MAYEEKWSCLLILNRYYKCIVEKFQDWEAIAYYFFWCKYHFATEQLKTLNQALNFN